MVNRTPRICLIDDDVIVLAAIARGLREAGYEVLTAPGAAAGLDMIGRNEIDAIVTDMNMPGTSGAQLIAEARASWPGLAIIAISGSPTFEGRSLLDQARRLGADALLGKPFQIAVLNQLLEKALAQKRKERSRMDVRSVSA